MMHLTATQAERQPGSYEPFVYLAAIQSGKTPGSIVDDTALLHLQLEP